MAKSEIVARVRKLLALAESDNRNEATLAAAKANELIERHALAVAEINEPIESRIGACIHDVGLDAPPEWLIELHSLVCGALGGVSLVRPKSRTFVFVGGREDFALCQYLFTYLQRQVRHLLYQWSRKRLASESLPTRLERTSYAFGIVASVGKRLRSQYRDRSDEPFLGHPAPSASYSLIERRHDAVWEYVRQLQAKVAPPQQLEIDGTPYAQGSADGQKVVIYHAIGHASPQPRMLAKSDRLRSL